MFTLKTNKQKFNNHAVYYGLKVEFDVNQPLSGTKTYFGRVIMNTLDNTIVISMDDFGLIIIERTVTDNNMIRILENDKSEKIITSRELDEFLNNMYIQVGGQRYKVSLVENKLVWTTCQGLEHKTLEVGDKFIHKGVEMTVGYIGKGVLSLKPDNMENEIAVVSTNKQRMETMGLTYIGG